jgi:hypothetical protein
MATKSKMHFGFLDESGILEKKAKEGNHFVVSVVVVANPVEIKDVVKVARKKSRGKFRAGGAFHAYKEGKSFIKNVLKELAKRDVKVIIGVWDRRRKGTRMGKNELYGNLVAQTVKATLKLYPKLDLVIHKRYTSPKFQRQLHDTIVRRTKNMDSVFIAISQQDEKQRKELELADAVAYAVFQKYNRKNSEFYEIIKERIKKESRLAA